MDDDVPGHPDDNGASALATSDWAGFTNVWTIGYHRIYAIRLVRHGAPAAVRVGSSPVMLLRWVALSFGLGIVTAAALAVLPGNNLLSATSEATLVLLLGLVDAGMFAAACMAWGYALTNSHTIDDLLRPCRARDWIVSVITSAVQSRWQSTLPLILAPLPWIIVLAGRNSGAWWSPAAILLLVNLTWTMLILGNVSYWLIVPPWLVVRMHSCTDIVLRWHDPARTPGIRTFAQGYGYTAVFLALGAVGATIPGVLDDDLLGRVRPYLYVWLLALSLWAGVFTQGMIYSIIRRFRLRALDQLSSPPEFMLAEHQTSQLRGMVAGNPNLLTVMSTYNAVATAPSLPYGTATIVQYFTVIVGSLLGVLLH